MTPRKQLFSADALSVAPMLDWTDRHFRYFVRLIARRPMLYTEMIACPALICGDRDRLLAHHPDERPLTLQVGGSDPRPMALCARMAEEYGYDAVDINAGCPSGRVQAGRFGAVLMQTPEVVADCVAAMRAAAGIPVSVKTRISLADAGGDGFDALLRFADAIRRAGCRHIIVHARQARLNLSPEDNRRKLPLNYEAVYRLKKSFPDMFITLNGNVLSLAAAREHAAQVDGVMLGRFAYGQPYALAEADRLFYGDAHAVPTRAEVLERMLPYLERNRERLPLILSHMMGLFHGRPNAGAYKRTLMTRDLSALRDFCRTADG
ncbi:MAG: tRNA dihydrouridine(20/20a) synthase DusA [Alphaproteobacteria bacterium]|nr:tRNA dihydrouridine(20/20a) synthase DusA [Alphaproteobacteria bacterium]